MLGRGYLHSSYLVFLCAPVKFSEVSSPPKSAEHVLYVYQEQTSFDIKPGKSKNHRKRARSAKTWNPLADWRLIAWRVFDSRELLDAAERRIHMALAGRVPYPVAGHEVKPCTPDVINFVEYLRQGLRIKLPVLKHKKFQESTPKPAIVPERQAFKGTNKKVEINENRSYDQRYVSNASSFRSSR